MPTKMEALIGEIQDKLDGLRMFVYERRNCPSCDLWDQVKVECGLYHAVPPPNVIVDGCEKFRNEIPF